MGSSNAYTSGVPPFAPGDPLSASAMEKMREADQRGLPQRSLGTYVRQTPSGTMVTPWRQPRRGTGTHPFKLVDASDNEGLKVEVVYGAVIDMTDWQDPKLIVPLIGEGKIIPDEEGRRPKLELPDGEEIDVFVVIRQGEHGRVDDDEEEGTPPEMVAHPIDSMPEITDGSLYVHVARITITENEHEGEEPTRRIDRIDQILGSHIVWPFKPDFVGWQHKKEDDEVKSAIWLGAGSEYIEDCDKLEDLHVKVQREEFDNGRDGDTVFELSMPEDSDKQSVLSFDKNQERGIEITMSEGQAPATRITVDRKTTVSGGLRVVSDEEGCEVGLVTVAEGGNLSLACKKEDDEVEARIEFDSENRAIIDMQAQDEKVIKFTKPEFDNGRDGDTEFKVSAQNDEAVTLSIDKNQERGFEAGAGESSSWISLDRKTTVSPGFRASSNDDEATTVLAGPNEGASVRLKAKEEESEFSVEAEDASCEIKAEANKVTQTFDAEDMQIVCRKEGFDNGRDGDSMFRAKTGGGGSVSISLDKNQQRGFEVGANDSSSWLRLDRKSTVGGGFGANSGSSEASASVNGPNEGASARMLAKENEARLSVEAEDASIEAKADQEAKVTLNSPSPEVSLAGSGGSTRVTTVDGKTIEMREISFMSSDGKTPMKAWFLASEPEEDDTDSNDHEGHHAEHHDGEGHQGHHAEHHTEHGTHHMGHYVDPDHDPDDSGLGHGSHHAGHHQGHQAEHHDDDEPHHSNHHTDSHSNST